MHILIARRSVTAEFAALPSNVCYIHQQFMTAASIRITTALANFLELPSIDEGKCTLHITKHFRTDVASTLSEFNYNHYKNMDRGKGKKGGDQEGKSDTRVTESKAR
jgi:hypothetical protein